MSKTSIIILNWKGLDDTRECCRSLVKIQSKDVHIYIVDNDSGDGSAEALAAEFPQFTHVINQKNLGFSGGNNAMMEVLLTEESKYLLLLNNDTVVDPSFLEAMVAAADADPKIGMVCPKIYYFNSPDLIWYAGGKLDFKGMWRFLSIGDGQQDNASLFSVAAETEWVTGCCLLVRSEVVKQIGGLDERFGYYCEDVDWCLRARRFGWKLWYEPKAKVWHKVNRSTARGSVPILYYSWRNMLLVASQQLKGPSRFRYLLRAVKNALGTTSDTVEKAVYLEATLHAILGRSGSANAPGMAWWCRQAAQIDQSYRFLKRVCVRGPGFLFRLALGKK